MKNYSLVYDTTHAVKCSQKRAYKPKTNILQGFCGYALNVCPKCSGFFGFSGKRSKGDPYLGISESDVYRYVYMYVFI